MPGTLRILEGAMLLPKKPASISTSELYGLVQETPRRNPPFYPRSPYGVAKHMPLTR